MSPEPTIQLIFLVYFNPSDHDCYARSLQNVPIQVELVERRGLEYWKEKVNATLCFDLSFHLLGI